MGDEFSEKKEKAKRLVWMAIPLTWATSPKIAYLASFGAEYPWAYFKLLSLSARTMGHLKMDEKTPYTAKTISPIIGFGEDIRKTKKLLAKLDEANLRAIEEDGGWYFQEAEIFAKSKSDAAVRMAKSRIRRKASQEPEGENSKTPDDQINGATPSQHKCNQSVTPCNQSVTQAQHFCNVVTDVAHSLEPKHKSEETSDGSKEIEEHSSKIKTGADGTEKPVIPANGQETKARGEAPRVSTPLESSFFVTSRQKDTDWLDGPVVNNKNASTREGQNDGTDQPNPSIEDLEKIGLDDKGKKFAEWVYRLYAKKQPKYKARLYQWVKENPAENGDPESIRKFYKECVSSSEWQDRLRRDPSFSFLPSVTRFLDSWRGNRDIKAMLSEPSDEDKQHQDAVDSGIEEFQKARAMSDEDLLAMEGNGSMKPGDSFANEIETRRSLGQIPPKGGQKQSGPPRPSGLAMPTVRTF